MFPVSFIIINRLYLRDCGAFLAGSLIFLKKTVETVESINYCVGLTSKTSSSTVVQYKDVLLPYNATNWM